MSLPDNINRLVATLFAMLQTRLELASVEFEEELIRFATYFIYTVIALFCAGVAVSLGIFLIIALFWDDHRVAVILTMIGVFGVTSAVIGVWINNQFTNKPRLLEHTIAEFKKDAELIRVRDENSEQEPV